MSANPIPVFPDVGSISVVFSSMSPLRSALSISANAVRSFTLRAGLKYSNFAKTRAFRCNSRCVPDSSSNGVFPMSSIKSCAIRTIFFSCLYYTCTSLSTTSPLRILNEFKRGSSSSNERMAYRIDGSLASRRSSWDGLEGDAG